MASIVPIYKQGDKLSVENYRPISVLNALAKVFEVVIYKRFLTFLHQNSVISPNQFGFVKNSSPLAACTQFVEAITKTIDNGRISGAIYIDMKKAFDSLNHIIFFAKLISSGAGTKAHKLLTSFLSNRKQAVKIKGKLGTFRIIYKGIPQGSKLGPLIFIFFINDLSKLGFKGTIQMYADDVILYYDCCNLEELQRFMQHDMDLLHQWLISNDMQLNIKINTI